MLVFAPKFANSHAKSVFKAVPQTVLSVTSGIASHLQSALLTFHVMMITVAKAVHEATFSQLKIVHNAKFQELKIV